MKKIAVVVVLFIVVLSANVFAASSLKVATIDTQAVLENSKVGKFKIGIVKEYYEQRKKMLESDDADLRKQVEEYQRQVATGALKDKAKQEREEMLQRREAEFQKQQNTFNNQIRQKQSEVFGELDQVIQGIIKDIAVKEKISLVINKSLSPQAGPIVLYSDDDLDLTKKVIAELDKREEKADKKEETKK